MTSTTKQNTNRHVLLLSAALLASFSPAQTAPVTWVGGDGQSWDNGSQAHLADRRDKEALADVQQALRRRPEQFAEFHQVKGKALEKLERYAEAAASYEMAIALIRQRKAFDHQQVAEAVHNDYADMLHRWKWRDKKDYRRAAQVLAQGIEALTPGQSPTLKLLHQKLGITLLDLGEVERAAAELRKAVALDQTFTAAHVGLALALARLGDSEGALSSAEKAVELDPESSAAWCVKGKIFERRQERNASRTAFDKAGALGSTCDFEWN
jgi:tetratricopeptide (TPR) repeat protein